MEDITFSTTSQLSLLPHPSTERFFRVSESVNLKKRKVDGVLISNFYHSQIAVLLNLTSLSIYFSFFLSFIPLFYLPQYLNP